LGSGSHPALYYDAAGIDRLRTLYGNHSPDDLGFVPHDAIAQIIS
jgi:hypothetical protein